MQILSPSANQRLNEATGIVFLVAAFLLVLSLVSYDPYDPSLNTAAEALRPNNWIGFPGAYFADFAYNTIGGGALVVPFLFLAAGWRRVRSQAIEAPWVKVMGSVALVASTCTALGFIEFWRPFADTIPTGGLVGMALATYLRANLNTTGALITTLTVIVLSLYLISSFSMQMVYAVLAGPAAWLLAKYEAVEAWWQARRLARQERAREKEALRKQEAALRKQELREEKQRAKEAREAARAEAQAGELPGGEGLAAAAYAAETPMAQGFGPPVSAYPGASHETAEEGFDNTPPWVETIARRKSQTAEAGPANAAIDEEEAEEAPAEEFIPIRTLEDLPPERPVAGFVPPPAAPAAQPVAELTASRRKKPNSSQTLYQIPPTEMLTEAPARTAFDELELKETAARIKAKFEEFNVRGSVVQINPGPVVTTFEYKPEAGVKYSRVTQLSEDLCLGLQAESILIERIPGKSTVGIEVPNTRREVIALRQILESDEFQHSASRLTIALGKDINGRIKVSALESMPHLLIAGSTGSGKSVMLNTLIMSILYKATPDEVRMIMVDPKRLELGLYEGIPHLLTPVITEPKKATYALRNAVLEMERRLKLLAAQQVRNIDQYNKKIKQLLSQPRSLFANENDPPEEELKPLPFLLIIIDELADLMMLERQGVEESVTRLAQMARAVGIHLVLATQRPSVDVITGLIKANFPSRISFRVATRVDSRTILDSMGAEHLLGKGDMLFLPPGSSRMVRVHGSYVSENETNEVVEYWKRQAAPEYDQSFLMAPPNEDGEEAEEEDTGEEDPLYRDAVRTVCEMGKASTSTLQRRLRLGYGRAARILDRMYKEGIIGAPDGSRPREVLRRPDWLDAPSELDEEDED